MGMGMVAMRLECATKIRNRIVQTNGNCIGFGRKFEMRHPDTELA